MIADQAIVLRSYPFGDADRVVVLISPNNGKIRTVAKGVRKTKSRFGGRLEPFTHVDLVLYEGRNLDTITQVAIVEPFAKLRHDLNSVVAAGLMVEAIDAVAQEDETSIRLFLSPAWSEGSRRRSLLGRLDHELSAQTGRCRRGSAGFGGVCDLWPARGLESILICCGRCALLDMPIGWGSAAPDRCHDLPGRPSPCRTDVLARRRPDALRRGYGASPTALWSITSIRKLSTMAVIE